MNRTQATTPYVKDKKRQKESGPSVNDQSLDVQLRQNLVSYVCDVDKFFLPLTKLNSIVQRNTVHHFLESGPDREYFQSEDLHSLTSITRYICGDPKSRGPRELRGARRVFAILVLLGKARSIVDFIKDGICDEDLPLVRHNVLGADFDLVRKDSEEKCCLTCFEEWPRRDIQQFDSYQWYMMSPFFAMKDGKADFYQLDSRIIFPWLAYDDAISQTDFSVVRRVKIHRAHHNFPSGSGDLFALKELKSQNKRDFDLEVVALKKIKPNPHLVTLLTTFEYQQRYCLLFGWAEGGNLLDLWKSHCPNPLINRSWVLWLAEQCQGLADALSGIHNTQLSFHQEPQNPSVIPNTGNGLDDKNCGRHGDIKPQNVLWFSKEENFYGHGVLKISDFGLTRFHSALTTKVTPSGISVSQTYKAPEYDLSEDLSRPFDVWSLGCLYLEFVTWVLLGWDGVAQFSYERFQEQDSRKKFRLDTFFNLWRHQGTEPRATVKDAVIQWIQNLYHKPACSPFLSEFVQYVEKHMILIDKLKRHKSGAVSQELKKMYKRSQDDLDYCFSQNLDAKPNPDSELEEDAGEVSTAKRDVPTVSVDAINRRYGGTNLCK